MDNLIIKTGAKEKIDTCILGPKKVRTVFNVPVNDDDTTEKNTTEKKKYARVIGMTEEEAHSSIEDLTVIPKDFKSIQPCADQVWNCDEIGIDPNGNWSKIVCT